MTIPETIHQSTGEKSVGAAKVRRAKIAHVTTVHQPLDNRVFDKECRSLAEAGFDVVIVAGHDKNETVKGVRIHGIPKPVGRIARMTKAQFHAWRAAMSEQADLYHFHDPELLFMALMLRLCGKRVVYDVHEDMRLKFWEKQYLAYPIRAVLSWVFGLFEDLCGLLFSGVVTATPHIARHFPRHKTEVIRNYPDFSEFQVTEGEVYAHRPFEATYIGLISKNRGGLRMTQAVGRAGTNPPAKFVLAGPINPADFEADLRAAPEWSCVDFKGFVDRQGIQEILGRARIGLLIYDPTPCYLDSYPIKLFEFMAAGIPVIASDFPVWREIVDGAQCGILVDTMNIEKISEAIRHLLENPAEAEAMGRRGREAAQNRFDWAKEAERLVQFYGRLLPSTLGPVRDPG